jgi:hypothetical protein
MSLEPQGSSVEGDWAEWSVGQVPMKLIECNS